MHLCQPPVFHLDLKPANVLGSLHLFFFARDTDLNLHVFPCCRLKANLCLSRLPILDLQEL